MLTSADFRLDKVDAATRKRLHASGESEMATVLDWIEADVGERPSGGYAPDFGCGVDRLTQAIAAHVQNAAGYDVSQSMLRIAREGASANASFTSLLPPGPFDWINSYMVFQHIPPSRRPRTALNDARARRAPSSASMSPARPMLRAPQSLFAASDAGATVACKGRTATTWAR